MPSIHSDHNTLHTSCSRQHQHCLGGRAAAAAVAFRAASPQHKLTNMLARQLLPPHNVLQQICSSQQQLRALLGVVSLQQHHHLGGDLRSSGSACGQQWASREHTFSTSSSSHIVTGHSRIPESRHDRYRTPPQNYVQLLQHITRSRDIPTLSKLVKEYGSKFDAVHVAAALAMMPRLYQPPAPGNHLNDKQLRERKRHAAKLMSQLQINASSLVPRMFAGQVSSITSALSRCSSLLPGGTSANTTTQQLLDAMLSRVTRDNARLLWQGANGLSVSQLLYGLSRMQYTPGSSSSGSGGLDSSSSSSGSAASAAGKATQQLCKIIARDPSRLQMRELATAAWSLGRMSRKRRGLAATAATAAALDALSAEVVSRRLWLRPTSMTGLLTAAVWLRRGDEALLAAICEEATHQLRDLRPPHLAAFAWALSTLDHCYTPPDALLSGLVSEARRQLQFFSAGSLGLLLQGLRLLGEPLQSEAGKQLLAEIAAGIASEPEVALSPRDAARILAAFVAVPDAGSMRDVEGMAQRIATAVKQSARNAPSSVVTDLVVCYSKLPYHHPMLLSLLEEAALRPSPAAVGNSSSSSSSRSFTLGHWVKLLQSASRLGYGRAVADVDTEARLHGVYAAAEARLKQHLQQVLGAKAGRAQQQTQQQQQQGDTSVSGLWNKLTQGFTGSDQQQQEAAAAKESFDAAQQQQQRAKEVAAVVELSQLLAARGALSPPTAAALADAAVVLLPGLKLRQVMQLLTALTSRDSMLGAEAVRGFISAAAEHVEGLDLGSTPTATTTVLVGLLEPLSKAVSRELATRPGERVMQAVYGELLPVLEECSREQLQAVWGAMRRSQVDDEALAGRAKEVAQRNGWLLQSGSLSV